MLFRSFQHLARAGRSAGANELDVSSAEAIVSDATSSEDCWKLCVERDGVRVWRRQVEGSAYDEVRGNGIIPAKPAVVLELLRRGDAETIREYNPMYDSGHDLQQLDADTKVSYGRVRAIFPFKPRDTVTRVALRNLPTLGGSALLLEAVEHPACLPKKDVVRLECPCTCPCTEHTSMGMLTDMHVLMHMHRSALRFCVVCIWFSP